MPPADDSLNELFEHSILSESNSGIDEGHLSDIDADVDRESLRLLRDINFSRLVERKTYTGFLLGSFTGESSHDAASAEGK